MGRWIIIISLCLVAAAEARGRTPPNEAQQRYERGTKAYNLGDWQHALEEFRQAYLAQADPVFLFDVAQCERQLGHHQEAVTAYRAYLREAGEISPSQREQVEALIARMQEALQSARAAEPPTGTAPPAVNPAPALAPVGTAPPAVNPAPALASVMLRDRPLHKRWWLWTTVAAVVLVAVGVGVGVGVGLAPHSVTYPDAGGADAAFHF